MSDAQKFTVIITRPTHQARALTHCLNEKHLDTFLFPSMRIVLRPPETLTSYLNKIHQYTAVVFQSANAVAALKPLSQPNTWPDVFGIGPATCQAIASQLNVAAKAPQTYSSEGLLALDTFLPSHKNETAASKKILLFCGENPRALLKTTLEKRGFTVEQAFCYQRVPETGSPEKKSALLRLDRPLLVCTSPDSLRFFWSQFEKEEQETLKKMPLVVSSNMLHQIATALGFSQITQAENATNEAITHHILRLKPDA